MNRLQVTQRSIERNVLNLKIKQKIEIGAIRFKTRLEDIGKVVKRSKWKYGGHIMRQQGGRWGKNCGRMDSIGWKEGKRKTSNPMEGRVPKGTRSYVEEEHLG